MVSTRLDRYGWNNHGLLQAWHSHRKEGGWKSAEKVSSLTVTHQRCRVNDWNGINQVWISGFRQGTWECSQLLIFIWSSRYSSMSTFTSIGLQVHWLELIMGIDKPEVSFIWITTVRNVIHFLLLPCYYLIHVIWCTAGFVILRDWSITNCSVFSVMVCFGYLNSFLWRSRFKVWGNINIIKLKVPSDTFNLIIFWLRSHICDLLLKNVINLSPEHSNTVINISSLIAQVVHFYGHDTSPCIVSKGHDSYFLWNDTGTSTS